MLDKLLFIHPMLQLYKEVCGLLAAGDKTALRQLVRCLLLACCVSHGLHRGREMASYQAIPQHAVPRMFPTAAPIRR